MNFQLLPFLFLLLSLNLINGQDVTTAPNATPPDPVSAQFQKYLGYPVSHATGLPQISIPLYTMSAGGIDMPFSLSYHASGIKVDQSAGTVGLGWSLYPGLKITRTIMGNPDDLYPVNDIRTNIDDFDYILGMITGNAEGTGAPSYDGQYDIFSIHLPTINANFIIEWNGTTPSVTMLPDRALDIKIITSPSSNSSAFLGFEVTDAQGVVYNFGGGSNYQEFPSSSPGATSWCLREIITPGINGSTISFSYKDSSANTTLAYSQSSVLNDYMVKGTPNNSTGCSTIPIGDWVSSPTAVINGEFNIYTTKELETLSYSTGEEITLNYSNDITGEYHKLQDIVFKDKFGSNLKTVTFTRGASSQLMSCQVSGEPAYSFVYNDDYDQDINSSNGRHSQDYLGLYNGKNNNFLLVPQMTIQTQPQYFFPNIGNVTVGNADRSFDAIKSQARILEQINYPTGGRTNFEYESNAFYTNGVASSGITQGMGLRVKTITTYDPITNKEITKTYKYGENENGIGYLTKSFLYEPKGFNNLFLKETFHHADGTYLYEQDPSTGNGSCILSREDLYGSRYRERRISSSSLYASHEPDIWYNEVTEYVGESAINQGKTIYNFDYTPSTYVDYHSAVSGYFYDFDIVDFSVPEYYTEILRNIGTGGPKLMSKTIKDANNSNVQYTEYKYLNAHWFYNGVMMSVRSYMYSIYDTSTYYPFSIFASPYNTDAEVETQYNGGRKNHFNYAQYSIEIEDSNVIETIQTDYFPSGNVVTTTNFEYDYNNRFNLKNKTIITSTTNEVIEEKYYYPVGDLAPDLTTLSSSQQAVIQNDFASHKNYHGNLIEKETYRDATLIGKQLIGYQDWGYNVYKPETVYVEKGNLGLRPIYTSEYDTNGNLKEVSQTDGSPIIYIWGYNEVYPIAKIENATYANVSSQVSNLQNLSNADNDRTQGDIGNEGALRTALNNLRGLSGLSNAMITTYTYDPQIGITSVTDPKGYTSYYVYDDFHRLIQVKDADGNILSETGYHYKGQ